MSKSDAPSGALTEAAACWTDPLSTVAALSMLAAAGKYPGQRVSEAYSSAASFRTEEKSHRQTITYFDRCVRSPWFAHALPQRMPEFVRIHRQSVDIEQTSKVAGS